MKDICEYGLVKEEELEFQPWKSYDADIYYEMEKRLDLKKLEPFFIVSHYPDTVSLLLKIKDNFKSEVFHKAGLQGNSEDWEKLTRILIEEYESENSGLDLFMFDCDEDIFCVFSDYIDALFRLAYCYIIPVCNDDNFFPITLTLCSDWLTAILYLYAMMTI